MRLLFVFLPVLIFGQSSFITQMEYASLLYKNPRGIGCHKCHGLKGEGKLIATYKDKGVLKEFRAPAINKLSYSEFASNINKSLPGMPKYYLTEGEIKALFFYLQQVNLEDENATK